MSTEEDPKPRTDPPPRREETREPPLQSPRWEPPSELPIPNRRDWPEEEPLKKGGDPVEEKPKR